MYQQDQDRNDNFYYPRIILYFGAFVTICMVAGVITIFTAEDEENLSSTDLVDKENMLSDAALAGAAIVNGFQTFASIGQFFFNHRPPEVQLDNNDELVVDQPVLNERKDECLSPCSTELLLNSEDAYRARNIQSMRFEDGSDVFLWVAKSKKSGQYGGQDRIYIRKARDDHFTGDEVELGFAFMGENVLVSQELSYPAIAEMDDEFMISLQQDYKFQNAEGKFETGNIVYYQIFDKATFNPKTDIELSLIPMNYQGNIIKKMPTSFPLINKYSMVLQAGYNQTDNSAFYVFGRVNAENPEDEQLLSVAKNTGIDKVSQYLQYFSSAAAILSGEDKLVAVAYEIFNDTNKIWSINVSVYRAKNLEPTSADDLKQFGDTIVISDQASDGYNSPASVIKATSDQGFFVTWVNQEDQSGDFSVRLLICKKEGKSFCEDSKEIIVSEPNASNISMVDAAWNPDCQEIVIVYHHKDDGIFAKFYGLDGKLRRTKSNISCENSCIVNTGTKGHQLGARVEYLPNSNGDIRVLWANHVNLNKVDLVGQRFDRCLNKIDFFNSTQTIENEDSDACGCGPTPSHKQKWYSTPGAIVGFTLGSIVAVGSIGFFAKKFIEHRDYNTLPESRLNL